MRMFLNTVLLARFIVASLLFLLSQQAMAQLPDPSSDRYCQAVQKILAQTDVKAINTIFDNMDDYRASKPSANPLNIYQVVTYSGSVPIAVSCKVKTVDHLKAVYGPDAAGEQGNCSDVTRITKEQAIAELLLSGNAEAMNRAKRFEIVDNKPYIAGRSYLQDFQLSFESEGRIYFNSPGLQTNWESWLFKLFPDSLRGQTYCHLATVDYMKSVALKDVQPGTLITTEDGAQTVPAN